MSPPVPRFPLGRVVATPGASAAMQEAGVAPADLLRRHVSGDWGDVPAELTTMELAGEIGARQQAVQELLPAVLEGYEQREGCRDATCPTPRHGTAWLKGPDSLLRCSRALGPISQRGIDQGDEPGLSSMSSTAAGNSLEPRGGPLPMPYGGARA